MFTGLVTARGTLAAVERDGDRLTLSIESPYTDLEEGESVAVNGACLTVVSHHRGRFVVQAVATTRSRTTLSDLREGTEVNLERALAVGDRLGGHFVQGHVDGVAQLVRRERLSDATLLYFEVPGPVAEVTVLHGSIAIDGVSLTVNALAPPRGVQVAIIPHTLACTTLGSLQIGDRVQVEADLLGKMVWQFLRRRAEGDSIDG